jgi:hypothetical protein
MAVFWNMTPCSLLDGYRCFGGTCFFNLKGKFLNNDLQDCTASNPRRQYSTSYLKSIIFWDMTPCSLLRCNLRFGGTYRLHLQGRRKHSACHLLTCWFLLKLFLRPRRWWRYVPPKRRLHLNRLHGVISQKMILFIIPTCFPSKYLSETDCVL